MRADPSWFGELGEELLSAYVHPALVVLGACCGSDIDNVGDSSGVVTVDGDGVDEGDAEVLEKLDNELEVFGAGGIDSTFSFGG